jgi:hypothetical protein
VDAPFVAPGTMARSIRELAGSPTPARAVGEPSVADPPVGIRVEAEAVGAEAEAVEAEAVATEAEAVEAEAVGAEDRPDPADGATLRRVTSVLGTSSPAGRALAKPRAGPRAVDPAAAEAPCRATAEAIDVEVDADADAAIAPPVRAKAPECAELTGRIELTAPTVGRSCVERRMAEGSWL